MEALGFSSDLKPKRKKMKLCGPSISTHTTRTQGKLRVDINPNKPFSKFVEIGRVAFIASGSDVGKICVIVDVIDQNRALVDGPCSGVLRQPISFKHLHLTKFRLKFPPSAGSAVVRKYWEKAEVSQKWAETSWAKKLAAKKIRARMTDFDRFKVSKAKQRRNLIIRNAIGVVKKKLLKDPLKKRPTRHAKKAKSIRARRAAKK